MDTTTDPTTEHVIKLLIVDDEARFLQAIAHRLSKRGFDVRTASNGLEALQAARYEQFDIALLDLKMPGMDGGEVLRELKAEHAFLEAIILTGHGSLDEGVEKFIQPFDKLIETLKDAYRARLEKKFAADQARIDEIVKIATGRSALGILRRLRALDDDRR